MQQQQLVPAAGRLQKGQLFALNQERYVTENWRIILGLFDPEDPLSAKTRLIRVFDRVATIRQKHIIVRTPIAAPDGFYELTAGGQLSYAGKCSEDIPTLVRGAIPTSEPILRESLHLFLNWVVWRADEHPEREKCRLIFERWCVTDFRDPRCRFQFKSRAHPGQMVKLPVGGEDIFLSAFHLQLALTECTRYDTVVFAYESQLDDIAPLFIGRNWKECVIVMPQPTYVRNTGAHG